jgi:biotin carboxyl carrier protein
MAVAYTPGLRVTADTIVRQQRRLPMQGEVLVTIGDAVSADDIVARAEMPGNLHSVRAAEILRVEPQELESHLVKRPGDAVEAGDVIARTRGLWGLFKSEVRSPAAGTLEEVSGVSGYARVRERPRRVEVSAHIGGRVVEVLAGEGAVIEARAAMVQGIFGVGGEKRGPVRMVAQGPDEMLAAESLGQCQGCVLIAGAGADQRAIAAAAEAGAAALVVGAVRDDALRAYVGYDIGVAITGQEDMPMALILTEGFGELPMAHRTWDLLRSLEGQLASVNGATQIRAGVIRPEIIVTRDAAAERRGQADAAEVGGELKVGARVRVIREPRFGALGKVAALPPELTEIETESRVRVAMVQLDGGPEVRVARANLELIQE